MTRSLPSPPPVRDAVASALDQLRRAGTWFDVGQLGAIVERAQTVFAQRSLPPWQRTLPATVDGLSDEAVAVVDTLATGASTIDRAWVRAQVARLGDGAYVELVGLTAVAVVLEIHAYAIGEAPPALPTPHHDPGQPTRARPDGLGDIGAYVPMLEPFPRANVARALSLVPSVNQLFYTLVRPLYSDAGFESLVWETPLSRPQVELVASRVAAMNECFY